MTKPASNGVMIAFYPPASVRNALASELPESVSAAEMHMTLAYLGKADKLDPAALAAVERMLHKFSEIQPPMPALIGGLGRFSASPTSDGKDVVYASVDCAELPEARGLLVTMLDIVNVSPSRKHGFCPHITLQYIEPVASVPLLNLPRHDFVFSEVVLVVAGVEKKFKLRGRPEEITKAASPDGEVVEILKSARGPDDTMILCDGAVDVGNVDEVVDSVVLAKCGYLIEAQDSPDMRVALGKLSMPFKLPGAPDKVYVSSQRLAKGVEVDRATVVKPFGGFADFDACLVSIRGQGHNEGEARRICGALERDFKAKRCEDLLRGRTIKFYAAPSLPLKSPKPPAATELFNGEERFVLGVVLEPETRDSQGDIYSEEEIRQAAHQFMEYFHNLGFMHRLLINGKAKILESYIALVDFEIDGQKVKKGSWLLGARILDTELWNGIKEGTIAAWSIGGSALKVPASSN
ncbi:MAG: hypothetical protein A2Y38_13905 [Spirochaetes bacterium GWB1_59_5]|nr:MAG: hypothetical protein A2Y38_13905 [Spirochaetes bacterium GWB1_59_5]